MGSKLEAAELLDSNHYCVISTASLAGVPWSTPLFYAFDSHCRLFWISATTCRHSQFLEENPCASAVIYEPPSVSCEASALYLSGSVKICEGGMLDYGLEVYMRRTMLGISGRAIDYQGESPCRMYCLTPEEAFSLQEPEWEDNLLLDRRVAITLPLPG